MSTRPSTRILALLRGLGGVTERGRQVDQLTHSLQAAARAERDGADNELVVGTLCHDIGHLLPVADHALIAARALDGYVRPEVVAIVASHTALDDDLDAPAYAGRPWLATALRFVVEWDRPSFDPHFACPSLADYAARVEAVFAAPRARAKVELSDLLGGMPVDVFVRGWFGARPFVDRTGGASRFDHLLDLATTEQLALRHHRDRAELDPGGRPYDRMQIEGANGCLPRGALHHSLLVPGGELEVLDLGAVSAHLAGGARVTVRAVDELVEALSDTTSSIAQGLGRAASMQAVATWRPGGQSASHASSHHLWILQLAGTRGWTVRDSGNDDEEYVLTPGDAMYVPANWCASWRDIGVPALHVATEVSDAAPRDLFDLVKPALVAVDDVRADLPLGQGPDRDAYAERLRRALVAALTVPA